jgi:hypothetical protein
MDDLCTFMIIRRRRFTCWVTKARIQTCHSTARVVTRKRLNGALYVNFLSCLEMRLQLWERMAQDELHLCARHLFD